MQSLPNYFQAPQRRALQPARPYNRRQNRKSVTRNMTSRTRPMRDPSDETTQFLTALVGFLRRQGYLPGQDMETGNFYHFYRLGAHDRRLTLNYDDAPWTMVQEQRLDDGLWVAMAPAQTVRGTPRSIDPLWLRVTIVSSVRFSPRSTNAMLGVIGT